MLASSKGLYFPQFLQFGQRPVAQVGWTSAERDQKTVGGFGLSVCAQQTQTLLESRIQVSGRFRRRMNSRGRRCSRRDIGSFR
jgi:hypothetical protein